MEVNGPRKNTERTPQSGPDKKKDTKTPAQASSAPTTGQEEATTTAKNAPNQAENRESVEQEAGLQRTVIVAKEMLTELGKENPKLAASPIFAGAMKIIAMAEKYGMFFENQVEKFVKGGPVLSPEEKKVVVAAIKNPSPTPITEVEKMIKADATAARRSTEGVCYAKFGMRIASTPDELMAKLCKLEVDGEKAYAASSTMASLFLKKKFKPGAIIMLALNPLSEANRKAKENEPFIAMIDQNGKLGTFASGKWELLGGNFGGFKEKYTLIAGLEETTKKPEAVAKAKKESGQTQQA